MTASVPAPTINATTFVFPASTACTNAMTRTSRPSPSPENPKTFGIWLTITVSAMPFM